MGSLLKSFQYTNHTIQLMEEQLSVCHDIVMNKMDFIDNHTHGLMKQSAKLINSIQIFYYICNMDMNQIALLKMETK